MVERQYKTRIAVTGNVSRIDFYSTASFVQNQLNKEIQLWQDFQGVPIIPKAVAYVGYRAFGLTKFVQDYLNKKVLASGKFRA